MRRSYNCTTGPDFYIFVQRTQILEEYNMHLLSLYLVYTIYMSVNVLSMEYNITMCYRFLFYLNSTIKISIGGQNSFSVIQFNIKYTIFNKSNHLRNFIK